MLKTFLSWFVVLFLASCAAAGDLRFRKHVINSRVDYSAAALVDVNHDGQIDVVCGGNWYEGPHWKKHFVAEIPRIGGRPDGFSHLEFDVNRDGWDDVITVNYRSRSIKWMEHPGKPTAGRPIEGWKIHRVAEPGPMETGRLVDVDGDGQLDLLPNGRNFAAWWELRWQDKSKKSTPAWIRHDLPIDAKGHGVGFGDIDGDGRGDIVGQHGWLQAPADARAGRWQWHADFSIERGSVPMLVVDPDKDGDNDIVWCSAHDFGVYWLEQSRDEDGKRSWHRHAIDTSWSQGHAPLWADLDGDGQGELIAGKRYMAHGGSDPGAYDPLVVYRYQFDLTTKTWDRWTVSRNEQVGLGLDPKVADIDNDGDLDLLAAGRSGLFWLENMGEGSFTANHDAPKPIDKNDENEEEGDGADSRESWAQRRAQAIAKVEETHGELPRPHDRVRLNVTRAGIEKSNKYRVEQMGYEIGGLDKPRQVSAELYIPNQAKFRKTSGLVCMFDTGQEESARQTAQRLASRGYVCLLPQLLTTPDKNPLMDRAWQAIRAADLLQSLPEVHGERIGYVGDALTGRLGVYVAALDPRFVATLVDASRAPGGSLPTSDAGIANVCIAPREIRVAEKFREQELKWLMDKLSPSR